MQSEEYVIKSETPAQRCCGVWQHLRGMLAIVAVAIVGSVWAVYAEKSCVQGFGAMHGKIDTPPRETFSQ